eukprot:4228770-Ditylum_brightwellii.AAC.1
MCRQHFDCVAKGQAKFIRFCKNHELLDPPKQAQRGGTAATSSTGTNQQILRKERGQEVNGPSLCTSQVWKNAAKYCMLHDNCGHTTNKCEALKKK